MRKIPILPIDRYAFARLSGKRSAKTFDPSRGGIGMRLKMARSKFNFAIKSSSPLKSTITVDSWPFTKRKRTLVKIAISMFVKGPASETRAISFLPSRRLKGSTGTGFAPPIMIDPERKRIRGRNTLKIGSICFRGSNVILPMSRAVGSPRRSATSPCAISWRIDEYIKTASAIMTLVTFM